MTSPIRESECGLTVEGDLAYEDWRAELERLGTAEARTPWKIGDLLNYGERAYGEKYAEAVDAGQGQTWRIYAYVAGRFELFRRRNKLSWSHHAEVASLPRPQADRLLDKTVREKWSVKDLRAAVRAKRQAERESVADALFDEFGQPIPDRLFGLWKVADDLRHTGARLQLAEAALGSLDYFPALGRVRDALEALELALADWPHCVCPRCDGDSTRAARCGLCSRRGWLSRAELEAAPEADRKRAGRFGGASRAQARPRPTT